jgi:hypothetical protein
MSAYEIKRDRSCLGPFRRLSKNTSCKTPIMDKKKKKCKMQFTTTHFLEKKIMVAKFQQTPIFVIRACSP